MTYEEWLTTAIEKDNAERELRLALIRLEDLEARTMQLRLDRLCKEHREVLRLWNGGKSRAEIANWINRDVKTVSNIISRLRKRLGGEQVRAARPQFIGKRWQ